MTKPNNNREANSRSELSFSPSSRRRRQSMNPLLCEVFTACKSMTRPSVLRQSKSTRRLTITSNAGNTSKIQMYLSKTHFFPNHILHNTNLCYPSCTCAAAATPARIGDGFGRHAEPTTTSTKIVACQSMNPRLSEIFIACKSMTPHSVLRQSKSTRSLTINNNQGNTT